MNTQSRWRFISLGVLMAASFALLIVALARLQIRGTTDEGVEYSAIAESTMKKTIYEKGVRGQIQDANGVILAYDKKIYNINFYRDPTSDRAANGEYSKAIWQVIQIARKEDKEISFPFWLAQNEQGEWEFATKTDDPDVAAKREKMFRSNFYVNTTETGKIFDKLCYNYMINEIDKEFPESEKLTLEDKLQVLGVWQEMQMNAFNSVPIKLVKDVKWSTMMEVETRKMQMPGISVTIENQRVYPRGTLACHVLGYTGLMQSESQIEEYLGKGYQRTDTIGLDGVEKSMEHWLTGNSLKRRGETVVEIDRSGKRIRELSKTEPTDGNTVKLTIDSGLQQVVERELANVVNQIRDTEEARVTDGKWLEANKEQLQYYDQIGRDIHYAQNGAIVVLDMNARVLAMASFPDYDPNLFIIGMDEAQRERMFDDRNPLYNNAIKAADTPGSVFKMATALAALANGVITLNEKIDDGGPFTVYDDKHAPKCWTNYPSNHAQQDIRLAIQNSCNYYFYTIADRLGEDGEKLYRYAAKLGLTSKTNIDLPNEKKSVVGSQVSLYDPSRPITGFDQDTWLPYQIREKLKKHLFAAGERWSYTYSDERLDKCVKALMDMAFNAKSSEWLTEIRRILMDELNMTQTMAYRADIVSDIVFWLNEIKWGGTQTIMTAIGQSISLITPVAMARYVAAVANGGYVYDVQIIDSIISPTGEVVASFDEPVLVNDLSGEVGEYLPTIRDGMFDVANEAGGTAEKVFRNWKYSNNIGGKTGTAEKSKIDIESNSWFVSFAPFENPEIVVVVYVPYGLSGAMSATAAKGVIEYYLESKQGVEAPVLPAPNGLAQ